MKHITIIAAMMFAVTLSAAENKNPADDWKDWMISEKIAFMTVELGITPEEAQAFWPVYNEVQQEQDVAMHNLFKAFDELEQALKAKRPEKEISRLLDNYHKALKIQAETEVNAIDKFKKVLPTEKLAKLYIAEEKFRRQQIRALSHPKPNGWK